MTLSAIGRSSSGILELMPGCAVCHTRPTLCGISATRTRLSSASMKRSRWLKGCPILLVWLLPRFLLAFCGNFDENHAQVKRARSA